jgi:hypothetical protein
MEILSTYETFFIIVETPNREGECLYQNKSLLMFHTMERNTMRDSYTSVQYCIVATLLV